MDEARQEKKIPSRYAEKIAKAEQKTIDDKKTDIQEREGLLPEFDIFDDNVKMFIIAIVAVIALLLLFFFVIRNPLCSDLAVVASHPFFCPK